MDKPISAGDLVQVIRACCSYSEEWLGHTFIARAAIRPLDCCSGCGTLHTGVPYFDGEVHFNSWRLKRIPPLEELESEKREEKLLEPV